MGTDGELDLDILPEAWYVTSSPNCEQPTDVETPQLFHKAHTCTLYTARLFVPTGYYSMSLVYFGIGPGALVAPAVIAKYGARRSMALACSTYTLYAVAHNLMEFGIGKSGQVQS